MRTFKFYIVLGGNGKGTWTSEKLLETPDESRKIKVFWPAMLAEDFNELAVYTLDYPAEVTNWLRTSVYDELPRICTPILEYISGKGIDEKPIVMVAHSLGGIVAKLLVKLSMTSKSIRLKQFAKNVKAISFIATPHAGSKWATVLNNINTIFPIIRTSDRVSELENDSFFLEDLSRWYRDNINPSYIETQAFFESKKTNKLLIVDRRSADPNISGCNPIRLNCNHIECCKISSKESLLYVTVSGLLNHHLIQTNDVATKSLLRPETVVVGIVENNGTVLMVRRRYHMDGLTWQFPAGRLRHGENEEECIIREVLEETGVKVKINEKIGIRSGDETKTLRHYYSCTYLDGDAENKDPVENSDVSWVETKKIKSFITTNINPDVESYLNICT